MTDIRLWHPSRDAYHAIYRILSVLLARSDKECGVAKLYILDFFIAFPSLLYRISLPMKPVDLNRKRKELELQRPEKKFMEYPSIQALFYSIEPYQKAAIQQLLTKGLINSHNLEEGVISLKEDALSDELISYLERNISNQAQLYDLIANGMGDVPLEGTNGIYDYTKLPRRLK